MDAPYCEVALPVPLRSVFTYAVPPGLREQAVPGSRVVVPFGRRAMVGVALRRLQRRGWIEMHEVAAGRKGRTQRIVAWKGFEGVAESKSIATIERLRKV